ncbi:MAG: hypothetical protein ACRDPW_00200, partial [Mycobacteriales bacterium]
AAPHGWDVRVQAGSAVVECESAEELIDYMWPYFVPTLGSAHSVGQPSRARLPDNIPAAVLDVLDRGDDAQNMRRLEAEILEWFHSGRPEPYVDDEVLHGVTTYQYGPGLFSEHGITVERGEGGRCALRFIDGGYGVSGVELAQRFAAFSRRTVTYDGPLEITATLLPPHDITGHPLLPPQYWTENTPGAYRLPVPVAELAAYYAAITGKPMDEAQLTEILVDTANRHLFDEGVDIPGGAALVDVVSHGVGRAEKLDMLLPSFRVPVRLEDPTAHSATVEALLALQERPRPEHPKGRLASGNTFTFDRDAAAQIQTIAAEHPPVVGERPTSARGCESVQVFATATVPEQVVVFYVGGRELDGFVSSARAAVTSLAERGAAEAAGGVHPRRTSLSLAIRVYRAVKHPCLATSSTCSETRCTPGGRVATGISYHPPRGS